MPPGDGPARRNGSNRALAWLRVVVGGYRTLTLTVPLVVTVLG